MTASLLTASFNFRGIFLTYWLKSRAAVLIFTSPLITPRLKVFQQIRVAMNYQILLFYLSEILHVQLFLGEETELERQRSPLI